jgi:flagellar assembly protein FliH
MMSIRRFIQETPDFDAMEAAKHEAVPEAPSFSEEELEAARTAAREEGRREGRAAALAEAEAAREKHIAMSLDLIGRACEALVRAETARALALETEIVSLGTAIARRLFPLLAAKGGLDEIETLVAERAVELSEAPRLILRVAPGVIDEIEKRLSDNRLTRPLMDNLTVLGDPALAETDCRLEWPDGGAERNLDSLWKEIEAIAGRVLAGAGPEDAREGCVAKISVEEGDVNG